MGSVVMMAAAGDRAAAAAVSPLTCDHCDTASGRRRQKALCSRRPLACGFARSAHRCFSFVARRCDRR